MVLLVFQITGFPWRFHQSRITNHFLVRSSLTGSTQPLTVAAVFVPPENENRIA